MASSKVLMVDDESGILSALQRLLRNEAFEVVTTQSIEEALRLFSDNEFAVVVSDQRMPDLTGTELLEKCQTLHPEAIRILLTGYADAQAAIDAINRGAVYRFLSKPWNDEELRLILRQAVHQFELQVENKRLEALTQSQNLQLLELNQTLEAKVASRTTEITQLNEDLQQSLMASIQMMAGLSELHSPLMGSHSKRVSQWCRQIAERMGVCDWQLTEIEIAATLHDIGKIGIPPEVLKQEGMGSVSRTDMDMIRQHPVKGESILLKMHNLKGAARMVRHHHEAFNGTGYPDHLSGRSIPLGSRIIAVVDAYDKLVNPRSLQQQMAPEKALMTLKSGSAILYDPDVVGHLHTLVSEQQESTSAEQVEMEIHPKDLTAGMVLSRDLITVRGALLLQQGAIIQAEQVERLKKFLEIDPVLEGLFVFRPQKTVSI